MSVPGVEKKCGCLSGLTDRQEVLVQLSGLLELVHWKVTTAKVAFTTTEPTDKAAAEYLCKVEMGMAKLRKWTTENGWKRDRSRDPGEDG